MPLPDDIDHEAERQDTLWQAYCRVAQTLDVGEVIAAVCAQIRGEPGDTPLSYFIGTQLALPQYDACHPLVTPLECERLGRWLAGLVCEEIHRQVGVAMSRED